MLRNWGRGTDADGGRRRYGRHAGRMVGDRVMMSSCFYPPVMQNGDDGIRSPSNPNTKPDAEFICAWRGKRGKAGRGNVEVQDKLEIYVELESCAPPKLHISQDGQYVRIGKRASGLRC